MSMRRGKRKETGGKRLIIIDVNDDYDALSRSRGCGEVRELVKE